MILEVYNKFNDHDFKVNDVVKITFLYKESMYMKINDSVIIIPENQVVREHIWCHINSVTKCHLIVEIANPCYYSKNRNNSPLKPGDILRIHKKYVKICKKYMSMEYIQFMPDLMDTNASSEQLSQYEEFKNRLSLFREEANIQLTSRIS
jgi:hypothetical protein